jgi:cell wall-associated NlpC family hydrolase
LSWAARWVGTPYRDHGRDEAGVDCWGLVVLIYRHELGIALPEYAGAYASPRERLEVAGLIQGEAPGWDRVPAGDERPGDVVLLQVRGQPCHVGIVTEPGWMLHAQSGSDTVHEPYERGRWATKVRAIYRYRPTAQSA